MNDEKTYQITGACMEGHKESGCGFLEVVYQDALEHELTLRSIPFVREKELPVYYKSKKLNSHYRVDFFCYDSIPLELKALKIMGSVEQSQIINYLKASRTKFGLLVNFGKPSLEYKRFAN